MGTTDEIEKLPAKLDRFLTKWDNEKRLAELIIQNLADKNKMIGHNFLSFWRQCPELRDLAYSCYKDEEDIRRELGRLDEVRVRHDRFKELHKHLVIVIKALIELIKKPADSKIEPKMRTAPDVEAEFKEQNDTLQAIKTQIVRIQSGVEKIRKELSDIRHLAEDFEHLG